MRRVPAPGPILGALPPPLRQDLDQLLALEQIRARQGPQVPDGAALAAGALLHVAAGGVAPDALLVLATGAAANQLAQLRRAQQNSVSTPEDVIQAAPGVARRAAAGWLREQAQRVDDPAKLSAGLCEQVARVALTLEDSTLRLLALEVAAEIEPTAARHLQVAAEAARQLDVDLAKGALTEARRLLPSTADRGGLERQALRAAGLPALLDAARTVVAARDSVTDDAARLRVARSLLRLERSSEARQLLAPASDAARSHLGLAAARALAEIDGSVCPGLPPGTTDPVLCATAFAQNPRVVPALRVLEQAWQSGGGRDESAVETYLGLTQIVPWLHEMAGADGRAPDGFLTRLGAVRRTAEEAASTFDSFRGLVVFVDALQAGVEALRSRVGGTRPRIPEPVVERLYASADELGRHATASRFAQGAVLLVAAFLMQDRDVLPLVERLPEGDALSSDAYRRTRSLLRAWCAVTRERPDTAEQARRELFDVLPSDAPDATAGAGPFERARIVLTLAELGVALAPQSRDDGLLARVAEPLTPPDVPPTLRLRASLDLAAARSRDGRTAEAEALLDSVTAGHESYLSVPSATRDLALAAQTYSLVLKARAASGADRIRFVQRLEALDEYTRAGGVSAAVELWRHMWIRELRYLAAAEKCAGGRRCLARAVETRRFSDAQIDAAVGAEAARLVRRGVLSLGTVGASFEFSGAAGLWPVVTLEPRFIAVEFPPR